MSYRRQCAFTLASEGVEEAEHVPPAIFHTLLENALTHNAYKYGAAFRLEAGTSGRGRRVYRLRSPLDEPARTHNGEGKGQALESVIAIHGADDYSELQTFDGRRHLHKKTLATLERLLPPPSSASTARTS